MGKVRKGAVLAHAVLPVQHGRGMTVCYIHQNFERINGGISGFHPLADLLQNIRFQRLRVRGKENHIILAAVECQRRHKNRVPQEFYKPHIRLPRKRERLLCRNIPF